MSRSRDRGRGPSRLFIGYVQVEFADGTTQALELELYSNGEGESWYRADTNRLCDYDPNGNTRDSQDILAALKRAGVLRGGKEPKRYRETTNLQADTPWHDA